MGADSLRRIRTFHLTTVRLIAAVPTVHNAVALCVLLQQAGAALTPVPDRRAARFCGSRGEKKKTSSALAKEANRLQMEEALPRVQLNSSLPSAQSSSPLHTKRGCRGLLPPQFFAGLAGKRKKKREKQTNKSRFADNLMCERAGRQAARAILISSCPISCPGP